MAIYDDKADPAKNWIKRGKNCWEWRFPEWGGPYYVIHYREEFDNGPDDWDDEAYIAYFCDPTTKNELELIHIGGTLEESKMMVDEDFEGE